MTACQAGPSRLVDGSPTVSTATSPVKVPVIESRREITLSTGNARDHHPHPLSKSPIIAANPVTSPLCVEALASPQASSIRHSLQRRRSSFPPSGRHFEAGAIHPGLTKGTTISGEYSNFAPDTFHGFGSDIGGGGIGSGLTPSSGVWESLLNLDVDYVDDQTFPTGVPFSMEGHVVGSPTLAMLRANSESGTNVPPRQSAPVPGPSITQTSKAGTVSTYDTLPNRTDVFGADLGWKTLLGNFVAVEGVGSVRVARLLAEIWKRGGGDIVTTQCLWPSIIMSLSLAPEKGTPVRVTTPTAHACLALQSLYNISLRHCEPSIFSGLLGSYLASTTPASINAFHESHVYGASTPTKPILEPDLSQWTTFTPGSEWPSLATTLPSGSGLTPRGSFSGPSGLPPIDVSIEPFDSTSRPGSREGEGVNGISEMLTQMEENKEERDADRDLVSSTFIPDHVNSNMGSQNIKKHSNFQLPTPETDTFDSPVGEPVYRRKASGSILDIDSPIEFASGSMASSPFVTANSAHSATSASTTIPSTGDDNAESGSSRAVVHGSNSRTRQVPPSQVQMPTAPFIPPPPMCMFFSPAFRDLQKGKVGVWKGDLVLRGRGGGTFNVLIIGEEGSDQLWQSQKWPKSLLYPCDPTPIESYTATMIPVSTLAREGLLPVTMGMVLCNDANIADYVNMVQGLHAEGVAFHLPLPGASLPIVFLPAKFDSNDPLQRLGIAFMSKGGVPPVFPSIAPLAFTQALPIPPAKDETGESERKKRRKSSSALVKVTSSTNGRRSSTSEISDNGPKGPR